jgi:hypothetical protein
MKEPTEFQYFKAWLLFFLIATVGGGIVGIIIGSFAAAFLGAGGMPLPQIRAFSRLSALSSPFRFPMSLFAA